MNRRWVIYDGDGRGLTRRDVFWNVFYGALTIIGLTVTAYFLMAAVADEAGAGTDEWLRATVNGDPALSVTVCFDPIDEMERPGPPPVPTCSGSWQTLTGSIVPAYPARVLVYAAGDKRFLRLEDAITGLKNCVRIPHSPAMGGGLGGGER